MSKNDLSDLEDLFDDPLDKEKWLSLVGTPSVASSKSSKSNSISSSGSQSCSNKISSSVPSSSRKKRNRSKNPLNTCIWIEHVPSSLSDEDLLKLCEKAGVILLDKYTGKPKLKRYSDNCALVAFLHPSAVDIAVQILDGYEIDSKTKLSVSRAQFKKKTSKPKTKKKKRLFDQSGALKWSDDAVEVKGPTILVIKNLFDPVRVLTQEHFYDELESLLKDTNKVFGKVLKVFTFPDHSQGVAMVKFETHESCKAALEYWNGFDWNGRILSAEYWDGVTNYKYIGISEKAKELRDKLFGSWLEVQNDPSILRVESANSPNNPAPSVSSIENSSPPP